MNKLILSLALVGFSILGFTGCGEKEAAVIAPATDADTGMTESQEQSYEEMMRSGAAGSSTRPPAAPGN